MNTVSRRQFLHTAAVGAATLSSFSSVLRAAAPDRTLKLGLIGCGGYGLVDVEAAFKVGGVEVIALCDVDSEHLSQSANKVEKRQGSRPKTFKNYEELLAVTGLDAVLIATPPHWHALQLIAALGRGLDVYCEKPPPTIFASVAPWPKPSRRAGGLCKSAFSVGKARRSRRCVIT